MNYKHRNPTRKMIGFLNAQSVISILLISFSFSIFGFVIFSLDSVRYAPLACLLAVGCLVIGSTLLVIGDGFDKRCYYCGGRIYNFQKGIILTWLEPTKYSGKEFEIQETLHVKCHQVAGANKFKIPHPSFKDFQI